MGWFDDDDDESEEEKQKINKNVASQNDDEDPLDAYMNSLKQEDSRPPRADRLDLDNAEEATSHWEIRHSKSKVKVKETVDDDENVSKEAKEALASTFHKAGSKKDNDKQVNITLDSVLHHEIKYEDFRKVFRSPTDSESGRLWRRDQHVICKPTTIDPIINFAEVANIFGKSLSETISKVGFQNPTPVQAQTLGVALAGRDGTFCFVSTICFLSFAN